GSSTGAANQSLQQTAAAIPVPESSTAQRAAAAAELCRYAHMKRLLVAATSAVILFSAGAVGSPSPPVVIWAERPSLEARPDVQAAATMLATEITHRKLFNLRGECLAYELDGIHRTLGVTRGGRRTLLPAGEPLDSRSGC